MERDHIDDGAQPEDNPETTRKFDASGTAHAAAARQHMPEELRAAESDDAAAIGLSGHMGESATSPGLAADLSRDDDVENEP